MSDIPHAVAIEAAINVGTKRWNACSIVGVTSGGVNPELRCRVKPALMTRILRTEVTPEIRVVLFVVELELVLSRPCFDFSKAEWSLALEWPLDFVYCFDMTLQIGVVCERFGMSATRLRAKQCFLVDVLDMGIP